MGFGTGANAVAVGKNWGRGIEKKNKTRKKGVTFKKKPKKSETEAAEITRLQSEYETFDTSKVKTFYNIPLSRKTLLGLKDAGYTKPTDIQKESIGLALRGLDVLGAAKTGSGKTLAFVVPILELLNAKLWSKEYGLGALVITPTRELACQIFETIRKVGKNHEFSASCIIGGQNLKFERGRMDTINIIIGTPGRLLQHMGENPLFDCSNLQILVLDEADRCLDMGFEKTMNSIVEYLPSERQTLLFSATQTKSVKDLARLSLKSPVYVSVHENSQFSTPENLQQSYVICPLESKLDMLWSFLKHHKKSKILVFLSSCKQVRFIHMLFCKMRPGISLLALYGTLHQQKRMAVYEEFCKKQAVVLFATDIAARGLDFPSVDWVLQLDCPEDATTYIHRAGRTARYNKNGESLLVLLPSEQEAMLEQLTTKKIPIEKIEVNPRNMVSVRRKFEAFLASNTTLKECAQRSFKAYLKSVFLMKNKSVFDVTQLDLPSFARSLGLAVAPRIRFLQKRLGEPDAKKKKKSKSTTEEPKNSDGDSDDDDVKIKVESEEEEEKDQDVSRAFIKSRTAPIYDFSFDDEDREDCDNLFVGKKSVKLEDNAEEDEAARNFLMPSTHDKAFKAKSKMAVAKKMLKKKIQSNKKIVFNEEGVEVADPRREQQSELAKSYEKEDASGIDIERAKEILKLEDVVDKKIHKDRIKAKHREERQKAKGIRRGLKGDEEEEDAIEEDDDRPLSSSGGGGEVKLLGKRKFGVEDVSSSDYSDDDDDDDDSGPDLSWLPDPDVVYGGAVNEDEDEDEDNVSDED